MNNTNINNSTFSNNNSTRDFKINNNSKLPFSTEPTCWFDLNKTTLQNFIVKPIIGQDRMRFTCKGVNFETDNTYNIDMTKYGINGYCTTPTPSSSYADYGQYVHYLIFAIFDDNLTKLEGFTIGINPILSIASGSGVNKGNSQTWTASSYPTYSFGTTSSFTVGGRVKLFDGTNDLYNFGTITDITGNNITVLADNESYGSNLTSYPRYIIGYDNYKPINIATGELLSDNYQLVGYLQLDSSDNIINISPFYTQNRYFITEIMLVNNGSVTSSITTNHTLLKGVSPFTNRIDYRYAIGSASAASMRVESKDAEGRTGVYMYKLAGTAYWVGDIKEYAKINNDYTLDFDFIYIAGTCYALLQLQGYYEGGTVC